MKTKILLLLSILFIATATFGQTRTLNQKLRLKKTPNLVAPDSIITKDANQVLRTTSIDDLENILGTGDFVSKTTADTITSIKTFTKDILFDDTAGTSLEISSTGSEGFIGRVEFSGNVSDADDKGVTINGQNSVGLFIGAESSPRFLTGSLGTIMNDTSIKMTAFPNTRNDGSGQNYLYTDVAGNVQSGAFGSLVENAPTSDISVIPATGLPLSTFDVVIQSKFLNNATVATVSVGTVNSQSIELNNFGSLILRMNYTSTATEESVDITLNNGFETTFADAFTVINGTIYSPINSEWTTTGSVSTNNNELNITTYDSAGSAKWDKIFEASKDYVARFKFKQSPLGVPAPLYGTTDLDLVNATTGSVLYTIALFPNGSGACDLQTINGGGGLVTSYAETQFNPDFLANFDALGERTLEFRNTSGVMTVVVDGVVVRTFPNATTDAKIRFLTKTFDFYDIEFIDLSSSTSAPEYNDNYLATGDNTSELTNDGDGVSPFQTEKRSQSEIVASYTVTPSDNTRTIWINSATDINITIDDTLPENFECYFYNINTGTATFVAGTGVIDTPDGTVLIEDKVCMLIKKENTNDFKIKGQLE